MRDQLHSARQRLGCLPARGGLAHRLGCDPTVARQLADDPARLAGVEVLGVDEHLWHGTPKAGKGPKELTGMANLHRARWSTPGSAAGLGAGPLRQGFADWLSSLGERFTAGVRTATLDPFRGYCNAIRDEPEDATAVLDAFHVVRLGLKAMEATRRRVQQEPLGHRGRKTAHHNSRCSRGLNPPVSSSDLAM